MHLPPLLFFNLSKIVKILHVEDNKILLAKAGCSRMGALFCTITYSKNIICTISFINLKLITLGHMLRVIDEVKPATLQGSALGTDLEASASFEKSSLKVTAAWTIVPLTFWTKRLLKQCKTNY